MTGAHLPAELVGGIHRRIHVASKTLLGVGESRYDVAERRRADYQQIDVACGPHRPHRRGPKDECDLNGRRNRRQCGSNDVGRAGGLQEQLLKLVEQRRLPIRLEVHLTAICLAGHQTRARQQLQLALHRALRRTRQPHKLT